jgi:hypothetical protein
VSRSKGKKGSRRETRHVRVCWRNGAHGSDDGSISRRRIAREARKDTCCQRGGLTHAGAGGQKARPFGEERQSGEGWAEISGEEGR